MVFRIIAFLLESDDAMRILIACSHGNRNNLMGNIHLCVQKFRQT